METTPALPGRVHAANGLCEGTPKGEGAGNRRRMVYGGEDVFGTQVLSEACHKN